MSEGDAGSAQRSAAPASDLPHRVRRQRWLVRTSSQEEALAARLRLREVLETELLPRMARALDAAVAPGEVLRVPRLELRLRLPSVSAIADTLPELLQRALGEQLAACTVEPRAGLPVTTRACLREALAHYLDSGDLPWALAGLAPGDVLAALRRELDAAPLALGATRSGALSPARVASLFRLLQLLPAAQWPTLLAASGDAAGDLALDERAPAGPDADRGPAPRAGSLDRGLPAGAAPKGVASLRTVITALATAQAEALPRYPRLRLCALALALAEAEGAGQPAALTDYARELPALLAWGKVAEEGHRAPPTAAGEAGASPTATRAAPARPRPVEEALSAAVCAFFLCRLPGAATDAGPERRPIARIEDLPTRGEDPVLRDLAPRARLTYAAPQQTPFGLRCCHAGLVLLHPYLPRFLSTTRVLRTGPAGGPTRVTLADEDLPRAAALLHLLSTGEDEAHEFTLPFIKVLLGLRPGSPLPIAAGLIEEEDRREADVLLRSVIAHWSVLKNTSPRGLQASFLQRSGLLRAGDQGLRLQVEPAAIDVLLARLPWGIGVVRLPWMTQALFTEWAGA